MNKFIIVRDERGYFRLLMYENGCYGKLIDKVKVDIVKTKESAWKYFEENSLNYNWELINK